jgi:hypothetical protein
MVIVTDDRVAATLAEIRERQALAADASLGFARMNERHDALIKVAYGDAPLLLKAVEAALKLADEACELEVKGVRMDWWDLSPSRLRAAITAALTGTQLSEDRSDHG